MIRKTTQSRERTLSPVKSEQTRGETKRFITDSDKEDLILRLSE